MMFLNIQIRLLSPVIISSMSGQQLNRHSGPYTSKLGSWLICGKIHFKEKLEDAHNDSNFYNWF